jgi:hypothetical protein
MNIANQRHCIVALPPSHHFQRLFDEVIELAVIETGLTPRQIQQNTQYPTPINVFVDEIEQAGALLADISENTAEIWLAVGCAVSLGKPLCLISSRPESRQPMDIQFLPLIPYPAAAFPSDYIQRQHNITAQLFAIMTRIEVAAPKPQLPIASAPPAQPRHTPGELVSYEIDALTIIARKATEVGLSPRELGIEMKAHESAHLTSHAMNALKRKGFIERKSVEIKEGNQLHVCDNLFLTGRGRDWLVRNRKRPVPAHRSASRPRELSGNGR